MRYQKTCRSCGRTFVIGEGEVHKLTRPEQMICEKEGLPWPLMVKVICGQCGALALVEESQLQPLSDGESPDVDTATAPATPPASPGKKRCPDCAEEINIDAKICRFCRFDYAKAAVEKAAATIVVQAMVDKAVEVVKKQTAENWLTRLRAFENQKIKVILLAHAGILVAGVVGQPFAAKRYSTGVKPPAGVYVAQLVIIAIFIGLAFLKWRKNRREEPFVIADWHREGMRFTCSCGRRIRNYGPIHYVLCAILIPYGYLSLLFRKKRCGQCGKPYAETLASG